MLLLALIFTATSLLGGVDGAADTSPVALTAATSSSSSSTIVSSSSSSSSRRRINHGVTSLLMDADANNESLPTYNYCFERGRKRKRGVECHSASASLLLNDEYSMMNPLSVRGGDVNDDHKNQQQLQRRRRQTLNALHQTSFLMVASTSMVVFAPLPSLTRHLVADNHLSTTTTQQSAQAKAVQILSLLSSISASIELLLSPSIGSLIDKFGRKVPHTILNSFIVFANLFVVLRPGVQSVCVSRMVNVVVGGFLVIVANAIVADMFNNSNNNNGSTNSSKSSGGGTSEMMGSVLAKQGVSISLGFLLGSIAGGRLTERGERVPYTAALALSILGTLNVVLRMGDSLELSRRGGADVGDKQMTNKERGVKQQSQSSSAWNDLSPLKFLEAPLSSVRLLFHYGSHMRTLAILLLLQSAPTFMGDVFQMFAREEWGLAPKDFANIVAIFGILGIISNMSIPLILQRFGLRSVSLFAILSSLFFPITTLFTSSSQTVLLAGCLGLYASAQKVGTSAAMTSLANDLGVPQGRLQGEKASMLALLKVICPLVYSELYLRGKAWSSIASSSGSGIGNYVVGKIGRKLPFVLNIILGLCAFAVAWQNL